MSRFVLSLALVFVPTIFAQSEPDSLSTARPTKARIQFDIAYTNLYSLNTTEDEKPLKTGLELNFELGFQVNDQVAIGGVFNAFNKSNSYTGTYPSDTYPYTQQIQIKDDVSLKFFGPAVMFRIMNNTRTAAFTGAVAGGYVSLNDDGAINGISATITGGTIGLLTEVGGEIYLAPNVALGVEVRNLNATISSRTINVGSQTVTNSTKQDVSRVSIGGGIRFLI